MSDARLFVVVSTGQRVANLPPLLEHAESGDRIVWVESDEARRGSWSSGAREVSRQLDLEELPDIVVGSLDDLAELVANSQAAVALARREGLRPHLILNGGPKLTPLGLLRAWGDLDPVLLYGEERPAVCKTFTSSLDQPAQVRHYSRHALDLPEVLEVSGHQVFGNQGTRFWPGPLTDDLANERYGVDAAHTVEWHRQLHQRGQTTAQAEEPDYADVQCLVGDRLLVWKRSLPALVGPNKRDLNVDGLYSNIYHATLNLAGEAAQALAGSRAGLPVLPPIGPAFERAVARRVHAWLEAERHPAVHSAWRHVKVASNHEPLRVIAEFDVLLILKNGVLWHLECKSFTMDIKDLDARVLNLQRAGSQLARMALCAPLFSAHVNEPWFAGQHERRRQIEGWRHLGFVPFTLPGQPESYCVVEEGEAQTFACPAMEAALERALAGYRLAGP